MTTYEFLRDQGSFIAGILTLVGGGLAYFAGRIQATATQKNLLRWPGNARAFIATPATGSQLRRRIFPKRLTVKSQGMSPRTG
jgi:hypothetical protein